MAKKTNLVFDSDFEHLSQNREEAMLKKKDEDLQETLASIPSPKSKEEDTKKSLLIYSKLHKRLKTYSAIEDDKIIDFVSRVLDEELLKKGY